MQYNGSDLITTAKINGRHCAYTLSIQNDIFRADTVTGAQCMPSGINVCIQILFGRFAGTHSVARIIVAEYVAVNALAESNEKACHLS